MNHIVWVFIMLSLCLQAQNNCNFNLSGKVTDIHSGEALVNATISLQDKKTGKSYTANSDREGKYNLHNLCIGSYLVKVEHAECSTKEHSVNINKNMVRNFSLEHHEKEIQEVIAIGKAMAQTKTSTESKLNKAQIDAYADSNLGTALKSIAGVNTLNTGGNIAKPVIHGLHSSRVPVLNNGIRQEDQEWGVEHAPNIDLNMANSITVVKGAGALQYAGDATGGLVILEPKRLPIKDTLQGSLLTSYNSNGKGGTASASVEKGWGNGWAFRVQGTYKKFGDLSAPDYTLSNTGFKENDASVQLGYHKHNFGIEAFYSYFGTEIGILRASHIGNLEDLVTAINSRKPLIVNDFTTRINSPKQQVQHNLAKFSTYYDFDFGKLSLTYGYQFDNRKEYDVRTGDFRNRPSLNFDLTTHDVNLDFAQNTFKGFKGKIGTSYTYQKNFPNAGTGTSPLIPFYEKNSLGAYWIENYQLTSDLTLEGGVRYDYQRINALKYYTKLRWRALGYDKKYSNLIIEDTGLYYLTNPILDYHGFAATLGANYKLGTATDVTLNYSMSSRAPNAAELFSDGLHHSAAVIELGDLELKNEKANKIMATFKSHLFDYRLNIEISPYYNYIKDFINEIPTGAEFTNRGAFPVWTYVQTNVDIYGIDVMADYDVVRNLNLSTNFSYLRGDDKKNKVALINMPPARWVNTLEYKNAKWNQFNVSISSTSVFRQNHYPNYNFPLDVVENGKIVTKIVDISTPPPAYQLFDFNTGFALDVTKKSKLDISFAVRNIFNTEYRDYLNRLRYYADEAGRNMILKLQYNF